MVCQAVDSVFVPRLPGTDLDASRSARSESGSGVVEKPSSLFGLSERETISFVWGSRPRISARKSELHPRACVMGAGEMHRGPVNGSPRLGMCRETFGVINSGEAGTRHRRQLRPLRRSCRTNGPCPNSFHISSHFLLADKLTRAPLAPPNDRKNASITFTPHETGGIRPESRIHFPAFQCFFFTATLHAVLVSSQMNLFLWTIKSFDGFTAMLSPGGGKNIGNYVTGRPGACLML
jgi:hypothetical protein